MTKVQDCVLRFVGIKPRETFKENLEPISVFIYGEKSNHLQPSLRGQKMVFKAKTWSFPYPKLYLLFAETHTANIYSGAIFIRLCSQSWDSEVNIKSFIELFRVNHLLLISSKISCVCRVSRCELWAKLTVSNLEMIPSTNKNRQIHHEA